MTTIRNSASVQSKFLFDRAVDTKTEKNILKYIKNVSTTENKPGSLLGKLGLKKEIQYDPASFVKLKELKDHLNLESRHNSKSLNGAINIMKSKMPKNTFLDYNKKERAIQDIQKSVAQQPKEEIIFINSSKKLENRFNILSQTDSYQRNNSHRERREFMSNNNVIVHHDKDLLIIEPKVNLFTNTIIRTTSNTHHYKVPLERAYNFAMECHLNIDDTIDQMYRALRHEGVNTQNLDIQFVAKEIDNGRSLKNHPYMQYSITDSVFVVTKQMDSKVVSGGFDDQPFVIHKNSLYGEMDPPVYYEIAEPIYDVIRQPIYAAIKRNTGPDRNIMRNENFKRAAYV